MSYLKYFILTIVFLVPEILTSSEVETYDDDTAALELTLVQVLYRHGDRTPVDPYPNDPYRPEKFWPEGYGQLTKRGKLQHYALGKYFRNRYSGFLNGSYSPYEIRVEASDADRALMSAESNLAGLFPPNGGVWLWNPKVKWQPIPVHTRPREMDNKLRMTASCPKMDRLIDEFEKSSLMQKLYKDNKSLMDYLSNCSGSVIDTVQKVDYLYDDLYIETLYNYTLPNWTKTVFPDGPFRDLRTFSFKALTYTLEMQRLKAGPLLGEMVHNFEAKINGSLDNRMKLFMYSAHDTTVASLLNTLETFNDLPPPYASTVILELHQDKASKSSFVKLLYKNETDHEPYLLTIPWCNSSLCHFEVFKSGASKKIPVDWEHECQEAFFGLNFPESLLLVLTFLAVILLLLVFAKLFIILRKRHQGTDKPAYPYVHLQMEDEDA